MTSRRFVLVGPGAVGLSLAAAWTRAGHRCVGVYGHGSRGVARARKLLGSRFPRRRSDDPPADFDILLFAVPDDAIAPAARQWSRKPDWKGRFCYHTSGALPAAALVPLGRRGARIASLHPLTSIPRPSTDRRLFKGVAFALEGDPRACALGEHLIRQIGGRPFRIPRGAKTSYHLAACLSSGYLLALLSMAAGHLERSAGLTHGQSQAGLLELAAGTVRNARQLGLERALTGPMVRGDSITLRRHLAALRRAPLPLRGVYRTLAGEMLRLLRKGGRVPSREAATLRRLLKY